MHSQKQLIRQQLLETGYVTNLWAIEHHIWRLSERIRELKADGMEIETKFENKVGGRNTKYVLIKGQQKLI